MRPIGRHAARSQVLSTFIAFTFVACFLSSPVYATTAPETSASGVSAYAYVGSSPTSGSGYISGFAVAADGSAQAVSGSPFSGASSSVVGSPNYLFATDGANLVTYTVGSEGSLDQTSSVNGKAYDLDPASSGVGGLSLSPDDHTLYTYEWYWDGANNVYLTWKAGSNGQLSYTAAPGLPPYSTAGGFPFAYSATGSFAYTWTVCSRDGSVWGFARRQDGSLIRLNNVGAAPPPPQQGQGGSDCSQAVASSATGFLAVAWNGDFCCGGPPVIATYAIQSNGSLALVAGSEQYISCDTSPMAFDPTGRYLAVGCNGIQVYGLGAQGALTPIGTAQEPSVPFASLSWDSANHLYGIPQNGWQECQNGGSACGLYVFNSNAGMLSLASGSPHATAQPGSLAVIQPR
jgi:hypothetical protein